MDTHRDLYHILHSGGLIWDNEVLPLPEHRQDHPFNVWSKPRDATCLWWWLTMTWLMLKDLGWSLGQHDSNSLQTILKTLHVWVFPHVSCEFLSCLRIVRFSKWKKSFLSTPTFCGKSCRSLSYITHIHKIHAFYCKFWCAQRFLCILFFAHIRAQFWGIVHIGEKIHFPCYYDGQCCNCLFSCYVNLERVEMMKSNCPWTTCVLHPPLFLLTGALFCV
jgi:hypothetical protein